MSSSARALYELSPSTVKCTTCARWSAFSLTGPRELATFGVNYDEQRRQVFLSLTLKERIGGDMAKFEETVEERAARAKAARAFYHQILQYRLGTPSLRESLRHWAERMGVAPASIIQWERGGTVSPHLIRRIVDNLGLPLSEFYRLFSIAEPSAPKYVQADAIPLHDLDDLVVRDGTLLGVPKDTVTIGHDWIEYDSAENMMAIQCSTDENEPIIPRQSVVLVDRSKSLEPKTLNQGAVWLVAKSPVRGRSHITLRAISTYDGEPWLVPINHMRYKPEPAWTSDLAKLVIGRAILVAGSPRIGPEELDARLRDSLSR
jgi:transcriptional regulator with XRE-family HTH domain